MPPGERNASAELNANFQAPNPTTSEGQMIQTTLWGPDSGGAPRTNTPNEDYMRKITSEDAARARERDTIKQSPDFDLLAAKYKIDPTDRQQFDADMAAYVKAQLATPEIAQQQLEAQTRTQSLEDIGKVKIADLAARLAPAKDAVRNGWNRLTAGLGRVRALAGKGITVGIGVSTERGRKEVSNRVGTAVGNAAERVGDAALS